MLQRRPTRIELKPEDKEEVCFVRVCVCAIAARAHARASLERAWCVFLCEIAHTLTLFTHKTHTQNAQKYAELKRREQLAAQQAAAKTQQQAGVAFAPLVREDAFVFAQAPPPPRAKRCARSHAQPTTQKTFSHTHTRNQDDTRTAAQRIGLQK